MRHEAPTSPEQKQHINISSYAYDIINHDSLTFMGRKNISGFINLIISNCGEGYFEGTDLKNKNSQLRSYPKEITLKIRLQDHVHQDYYPDIGEWFGFKYKISQSEYIKALVEDYARKPFYDREGIFYRNTINALQDQINNPQKELLPLILNDGRKCYVKPYRISNNYEARYHYLLCLSSYSADDTWNYTSIRISNIASVKNSLSTRSGRVTKEQIKELEKRAKQNGVPYIMGETEEFTVRLTSTGLNMYNSIYHQRPIYSSIDNTDDEAHILTFNCTERQMTNYFFQFGKNAIILSPSRVRDKMMERYNDALETYKKV